MRNEHKGAAKSTVLTVALGGTTADLTITCSDLTGWPTGSVGPFYASIDRGLATEEKVLCSSRTGNVLTVWSSGGSYGRAQDNTTITSHAINATIEHVFTAVEADAANAHIEASTAVHGLAGAVVGTTDTQTLTNKTLTSPTINTATLNTATLNNTTFTGTITGIDSTETVSPLFLMGG